jgi:uncharacterized protein (TIGR01777 family)
MRILIAGGTGMIGKPLAERLLKSGHEVSILTRDPKKGRFSQEIDLIQWDGVNHGDWSQRMGEMEGVINLVGENIGSQRWSPNRKKRIIESRVNAGKLMSEAIAKVTILPKVFIQASAIGYFGTLGSEPLTEGSPSGNDFLADVCLRWEESSRSLESRGIRRVVIRTGVVLSKEEGALNRMLMPFKFFIGGPIGNGKQIISWIHPYDEIAAIQFLLENEQTGGIYNLTSPEPVSNASFGLSLAKTIQRPYWMPVPAFALRMTLGEMSTLVLEGQNVIPKRLTEAGFQFKYKKLEDALKNLLN